MKWISVNDRLPEQFKEVSVKDELGNEFVANYSKYEVAFQLDAELTWYEDNEGYILYGITHWKPLEEL